MQVRLFWLPSLVLLAVAGCAAAPAGLRRALVSPYKPSNVYVRQPQLPAEIRRVAVLPVTPALVEPGEVAGANLLGPLLTAELGKRKLFEAVAISPEQLRVLTGRRYWMAEDMLAPDFFARLHESTGCDAVLFATLTSFSPYPPLRAGWKARLVDCGQQQTWWSVDETFDAGATSVVAAAEAYARSNLNLPDPLMDDTGVLHSPLRFGQYTAQAIAGTLPGR